MFSSVTAGWETCLSEKTYKNKMTQYFNFQHPQHEHLYVVSLSCFSWEDRKVVQALSVKVLQSNFMLDDCCL